jgi:hypothetical protein
LVLMSAPSIRFRLQRVMISVIGAKVGLRDRPGGRWAKAAIGAAKMRRLK